MSTNPSSCSIYPRDKDAVINAEECTGLLYSNRRKDKDVPVTADLPCNVIVIHGVNDVGTSFEQVEQGLCAGLGERVASDKDRFRPGIYRTPKEQDRGKLLDDPDAVFFKRQLPEKHHTPVIPFYWGFRELKGHYKNGKDTFHGQNTDQYGNRLDKDFSKGGGPFANATSTLPDMWGPGKWGAFGLLNKANGDPLRPVLGNPGRLYMILAARRLAALISMIRDWHPDETVNLVAHSQGCMLSLLAQAFLMEQKLRPADTLILTHPPYSLVDDVALLTKMANTVSGEDDVMKERYHHLEGGQTLHARLETLARIVQGVTRARHASPSFTDLKEPTYRGMVGARWQATAPERDNRGKVYLYFCPEDMTVALRNVQGIGWQGVPDAQNGSRLVDKPSQARGAAASTVLEEIRRSPLKELGSGFFQRVFTSKKRPDPKKGDLVLIGQASPHDFVLRADGEDGFEHVDKMARYNLGRYFRAPLDEASSGDRQSEQGSREGLRRINGEPLPQPVKPEMFANSSDPKDLPAKLKDTPKGAYENVDPIDAAIASTQISGYEPVWQLVEDPTQRPSGGRTRDDFSGDGGENDSPFPAVFKGRVRATHNKGAQVLQQINQGKPPNHCCPRILQVYTCMDAKVPRTSSGTLLVQRLETPDEARLRWQQKGVSERSFHGAIFGSKANHENVTAYDLALGGGQACSDAKFYAYLCAVADWRLTTDSGSKRPGILKWKEFLEKHGPCFNVEPKWRKDLIEGNAAYYSTGKLPECLPLLPEGLPPAVVCETMARQHIAPLDPAAPSKPAFDGRKAQADVPAHWQQASDLPSGRSWT